MRSEITWKYLEVPWNGTCAAVLVKYPLNMRACDSCFVCSCYCINCILKKTSTQIIIDIHWSVQSLSESLCMTRAFQNSLINVSIKLTAADEQLSPTWLLCVCVCVRSVAVTFPPLQANTSTPEPTAADTASTTSRHVCLDFKGERLAWYQSHAPALYATLTCSSCFLLFSTVASCLMETVHLNWYSYFHIIFRHPQKNSCLWPVTAHFLSYCSFFWQFHSKLQCKYLNLASFIQQLEYSTRHV